MCSSGLVLYLMFLQLMIWCAMIKNRFSANTGERQIRERQGGAQRVVEITTSKGKTRLALDLSDYSKVNVLFILRTFVALSIFVCFPLSSFTLCRRRRPTARRDVDSFSVSFEKFFCALFCCACFVVGTLSKVSVTILFTLRPTWMKTRESAPIWLVDDRWRSGYLKC